LVATSETVADAEAVASACDVAFTITVAVLGRPGGAVYTPALLIVPHALPEQPEPLTDQLTALLVVPATLTWKVCCAPTATIALVGESVTTTGARIVTAAVADSLSSATDVAVMTTFDGMLSGAV
jgi:hypothetical protein